MHNPKKLLTHGFLVSNRHLHLKRLRGQATVALLMLIVLTIMLCGPQTRTVVRADSTAPASKLTDDLQSRINARPGDRIAVIIQTNGSPSSGLLNALTQSSGSVRRTFRNLNGVAVELPARAVAALANRPDVGHVSFDMPTASTGHLETTTGAAQARSYGTAATGAINGQGIGIAILDSGVTPGHHAFRTDNSTTRVIANVDFTGEGRTDDPYGHGTHVAAIAAANDHISQGAYTGIASAANILNVRVLNSQGQGSTSSAIAGIDWCITNKAVYNIRVLNLSFGATAVDSYKTDPLCLAVRRAFNAGIVVCVAAGNSGKDASGNKIYGAIHSPGIEPSAITVGAANSFGTDTRSDDAMASYSSHGPTRGYYKDTLGRKHYDNLFKPDLVAPGNKLIEAKAPSNELVAAHPELDASTNNNPDHGVMFMSGTSMATPVVAGAAALVLQRNPALTPNLVKAVLELTAQPLAGVNTLEQGAGELNVEGAVRLAGCIQPNLSGLTVGAPLLVGAAPLRTSTIAGTTFSWGSGLIQRWGMVSGNNLFSKYQGIYGTGTLLSSGALLADGTLLSDGVLFSDGALLSDGALFSDGVLLSTGALLSDGTLLSSGALFADGALLADGALFADGALLSDGVLLSDSALSASTSASASLAIGQSILTNGDGTQGMAPTQDLMLEGW